jgi:transcriptional regulator with XRE-family HTH domain
VQEAPVQRSALAVARFSRGFSQEALAQRAGISSETLRRLELGLGGPRLSTARALAQTLGVPVDSIFPADDREA